MTSRKAALVGPSALMTLAGDLVLRVDPASDGAALTGRATPPRLRFGVAAQGEVFITAGAAQVASVLPRLARPTIGRRLRIQPQVTEDLLDHSPLHDGRDDLASDRRLQGDLLEGVDVAVGSGVPVRG